MVFGLIGAVVLARGSLRKAIAMVVLGLVFGLVGTDVNSGTMRFTFCIPALAEGASFVALAMGMFGIAEVVYNLEQRGQYRQVHLAPRPRAAEPGGSQPQQVVDRARHRARLHPRHPAGRRRAAGVVCRLYDREEGGEAAARFRQR